MDWNELIIEVAVKDLETASAVATAASPGGLYIEDYSDMLKTLQQTGRFDGVSEALLQKDTERAVIHLYLAEEHPLHEAAAYIEERLSAESIEFELTKALVKETDWALNWKQYYRPQKIGGRLVVCPSWELYEPAAGEVVITLDPGMSFGTGEHESTRLCLAFLDETELSGLRLLDVGTGSGILAIAALKLKAASVTAIDIDPVSVRIARENAVINGVEMGFCALCADVTDGEHPELEGGGYDVVTANITADFHSVAAGFYFGMLNPGGILIASGIISTSEDVLEKALKSAGFGDFKTKTQNGWTAVLAVKPEPRQG